MLRHQSKTVLRRSLIARSSCAVRTISTSRRLLNAQVIDGKAAAKTIRGHIHDEIAQIQRAKPQFQPKLVIIQVGSRPDSSTYVRMKLKAANEAKIECDLRTFPESMTERDLLDEIEDLNNEPSVHGILVQLPLPKDFNEKRVTEAVCAEKDVDGFGTLNIGELARRGGSPLFVPCTPKGVMALLKEYNVELKGKRAVVIGRSDIVGNPVSYLLKNSDATVTVCHRHTENLQEYLKDADIVVAAVGIPQFVKGEWLKPGAVVIDVGINYIADSSKKSGQRLVGDVDFESAKPVCSKLTPVPGGVGPMTVAMLVQNVVNSAKTAYQTQERRHVEPLPLRAQSPVPSDIDISRSQHPKKIKDLAHELGITDHELEQHGQFKAKLNLSLYDRLKHRKDGNYVLVAGITPTPLGEGKSTTTMGIVQALGAHLNKLSVATVRQGSLGPTMGIKGGAAGGGYSQVIPMDEFNMHLTGDIHAVAIANNMLAAAIDTRMFHESSQKDAALLRRLTPKNKFTPSMLGRLKRLGIDKTDPKQLTTEEAAKFVRLDIDPDTITWKRVVDINDRHLRGITIGEAPTEKGHIRKTGFDIAVASEVMAVLALSRDSKDMRQRLGRMVVASSKSGLPITADDIGAGGALTALMADAIKPNMMQSLEGTPVLVHAGPFANISIGANSVIADKLALKLTGTEHGEDAAEKSGYVVTEAGFDFTMGGERFFNIKCRQSGLVPDTAVIVATVRALKLHGGGPEVKPGTPLPDAYVQENVDLVRTGAANLKKQIENARSFGVPVVVAINRFVSDTDAEIEAIRQEALAAGAFDAISTTHWEHGGAGAVELAKGVIKSCESSNRSDFKLLYDEHTSAVEKLNTIAQKMYGADGVELSPLAQEQIDRYTKQGFGELPICIAKTQYSLSHDAALKNVPTGFTVPIREVRVAAGGGYLFALAGPVQTMPGLATYGAFMNVELDDEGNIQGLF